MQPLVDELRNDPVDTVMGRIDEECQIGFEDLELRLVDHICGYVLNWCEFQFSWKEGGAPRFHLRFES